MNKLIILKTVAIPSFLFVIPSGFYIPVRFDVETEIHPTGVFVKKDIKNIFARTSEMVIQIYCLLKFKKERT